MYIMQTDFNSALGKQAAALRIEVFVHEQGVPAEEEVDMFDPKAIHFVAFEDGAVIGTLRIVSIVKIDEAMAKIGRVAVAKKYRSRGVGRELMRAAIDYAKRAGFHVCSLDAQVPVVPFYEKLGFVPEGPVFNECQIPHRRMTLELHAHV